MRQGQEQNTKNKILLSEFYSLFSILYTLHSAVFVVEVDEGQKEQEQDKTEDCYQAQAAPSETNDERRTTNTS
jgi:hypothetical protein